MIIGRQLKKMNIKYRKREKTPKYTIEQQIKAKKRSRKLVNQLYNTKSHLVIDDKKYFCFAGDNMPGNSGYYTKNKKTCPESVRFIGKKEIFKKIIKLDSHIRPWYIRAIVSHFQGCGNQFINLY